MAKRLKTDVQRIALSVLHRAQSIDVFAATTSLRVSATFPALNAHSVVASTALTCCHCVCTLVDRAPIQPLSLNEAQFLARVHALRYLLFYNAPSSCARYNLDSCPYYCMALLTISDRKARVDSVLDRNGVATTLRPFRRPVDASAATLPLSRAFGSFPGPSSQGVRARFPRKRKRQLHVDTLFVGQEVLSLRHSSRVAPIHFPPRPAYLHGHSFLVRRPRGNAGCRNSQRQVNTPLLYASAP